MEAEILHLNQSCLCILLEVVELELRVERKESLLAVAFNKARIFCLQLDEHFSAECLVELLEAIGHHTM